MAQKNVLVLFTHAPHGTIWYAEGLRATVGATAGIDEHVAEVLFLGDGAYAALKGVDRTQTTRYLGTLSALDSVPKVDEESLRARRIDRADLADDVEVVLRSQVLAMIERAGVTVDF